MLYYLNSQTESLPFKSLQNVNREIAEYYFPM